MRTTKKIKRTNKSTHTLGQALLEFALVVTMLTLVFWGALDLGRVFHTEIIITNSAREGARYLVLQPDDQSGAKLAALNEATNSGITLDLTDISITRCTDVVLPNGCDRNSAVEVTVTKNFYLLVEILFPNPLVLQSYSRMIVP